MMSDSAASIGPLRNIKFKCIRVEWSDDAMNIVATLDKKMQELYGHDQVVLDFESAHMELKLSKVFNVVQHIKVCF